MAWLGLDSGDADLRRFLTHLVAAVRTAEPEAGVDALALLEAGDITPTEAVARPSRGTRSSCNGGIRPSTTIGTATVARPVTMRRVRAR